MKLEWQLSSIDTHNSHKSNGPVFTLTGEDTGQVAHYKNPQKVDQQKHFAMHSPPYITNYK